MADWLQQFVDDGTIGESQLEEARQMAANIGITVEDSLVRLGYIESKQLGQAQAAAFNYEYVELEGLQIPPRVIELITESMARENIVIARKVNARVTRMIKLGMEISKLLKREVGDNFRITTTINTICSVRENRSLGSPI